MALKPSEPTDLLWSLCMWDVTQATLIARIMYAAPAWREFLSVTEKDRIESAIKKPSATATYQAILKMYVLLWNVWNLNYSTTFEWQRCNCFTAPVETIDWLFAVTFVTDNARSSNDDCYIAVSIYVSTICWRRSVLWHYIGRRGLTTPWKRWPQIKIIFTKSVRLDAALPIY